MADNPATELTDATAAEDVVGRRRPGRGGLDRWHVRCLLSRARAGRSTWTPPGGWHPQVSVRPERFGALLYHFGTRQLSFLKSPALLAVVRGARRPSPAPGPRAGRPACRTPSCPRYGGALGTLAASQMICHEEAA